MKKTLSILMLLVACVGLTGCDDNDTTLVADNPPQLISIIPKAGWTGATAIISGVHFSGNIPDNEVSINGVKASITVATHNRLVITLPDNPVGEYPVRLTVKGRTTEGLSFRYAPAPAEPELNVLHLMPSAAYSGDDIKLIGQCFSPVADENTVTINGVTARVKEASETVLTITVPETEEGSYPVMVTVGDRQVQGPRFTYLHTVTLTTASMTPESGRPGQKIVITGEGFGDTPADNHVTINEVDAEVIAVTPTTLTIVAPENPAGTYPVTVTVGDKTVSNLTYTYVTKGLIVTTVAGNGASETKDGQGIGAAIRSPQGLAFAADGSLWIAQQNGNALRRMDTSGYVSTVSVTGASLSAPWGCAFAPGGTFTLANKANNTVINVAADGAATQVNAVNGYKSPMGVCYDKDGNLYVADRDNKCIHKFTPAGVETTIAVGEKQGPCAVAADARGRIYAVNGGDYKVFVIDTDGTVSTLFGTGEKPTADTWSDGVPGNPATATMGQSFGITIAGDGTMYITDLLAFVVRRLTPGADGDYASGTLETIAGIPFTKGKADGAADKATFNQLGGVAVKDGRIYVSDNVNNLIREISE